MFGHNPLHASRHWSLPMAAVKATNSCNDAALYSHYRQFWMTWRYDVTGHTENGETGGDQGLSGEGHAHRTYAGDWSLPPTWRHRFLNLITLFLCINLFRCQWSLPKPNHTIWVPKGKKSKPNLVCQALHALILKGHMTKQRYVMKWRYKWPYTHDTDSESMVSWVNVNWWEI